VGVRGTTHWEDPQVLACKKNKKKSAEKKTKQKIHSNKYNQSTWRGRHMHLKVVAVGG